MSKIYIDIGHGAPTKNPGATYKGRTEAADVIKLSRKVGELLTKQGVEVKFSRADDKDPSITSRCNDANNWGADYFISVHRNAVAPNVAKGWEGWIYSKAALNGDAFNKAKNIVDAVCNACGFVNRGVKRGAPNYTDYGVNSQTKMTSCLIECGFVDSDVDNKIFDEKFEAMAKAMAKGLMLAVGLEYKEKTVTNTTPSKQDYEVVVGGAMDFQHAQWCAERLRKTEDSVYIRLIGDVDGDGKVSVADARHILRKAVELE